MIHQTAITIPDIDNCCARMILNELFRTRNLDNYFCTFPRIALNGLILYGGPMFLFNTPLDICFTCKFSANRNSKYVSPYFVSQQNRILCSTEKGKLMKQHIILKVFSPALV